MRRGTNLPLIRDYNQGVVLEAIRTGHEVSRVEIAGKTGLTAQTVTNIVRRLLDEELVIEDGLAASSGGKPRVKLRINPDARYAVGAVIDRDEATVVIMSLDGRIAARKNFPIAQEGGPLGLVEQVSGAVKGLICEGAVKPEKILGVGIGCPGPMDHIKGIAYEPLNMFGWREILLKEAFEERLGLPVVVDNDATAAAIGERWVGGTQGVRNFAFIFVGMGVGSGLFIEDQLYRGSTTNAGEFGHVTLNLEGPVCYCGNRGCIEVFCAPRRIIRIVRERLEEGEPSLLNGERLDMAAISQAALAGDALALDALNQSACYLAQGIVSLVNLLDLEMVVLGGKTLRDIGPLYRDKIQATLNEKLIARKIRRVRVELSAAGEEAGAVGAAALILHEIYAPRLARL